MGNRTWKKLCFALIYLIPVIIFISTLSKMYKVFWNVNACMSDYYLAVFDWKTISFMGLFEMIYVSFVSIVIIKRNMTSNRIVLYQLMGKMWRDCIKRTVRRISVHFAGKQLHRLYDRRSGGKRLY